MPPRKPVDTLKQLCIQEINKNTDTYPLQEIHALPTTLLEELINFPNDSNQEFNSKIKSLNISLRHKTQMITENITRLSLSVLDQTDIENALSLIPKHFKNLKRFACEEPEKNVELSHQQILSLIHSFPNIIDLYMRCHNVNDDILEAIGDNCPNLERLSLTWCKVTDDGISRFCHSKSRGSNITYLVIGSSRLTVKGHLMALQNLKHLRDLDGWNPGVILAFIKFFQDLKGSQKLPTFELRELRSFSMKDKPTGFLNFVTKCCPNLSKLSISISNNITNVLLELKKCDKIPPLKIRLYENFSMSLLTDFGSNVTSLHLHCVDVDLELLGYTFLNLKKLKLADVIYQPIVNFKSKNSVIPFRKLQTLKIRGDISSPYRIPVPQLKFLFKNCLDLELLRMTETDIDADSFISLIHDVNPLRYLTRLEIHEFCTISKVIVLELLKMENNLQVISIISYGEAFSGQDKYEIECYVKENNLRTCVHFDKRWWE